MPQIFVKCDSLHYWLSDGVDDGPIVPYGDRATLDMPDGNIYTCLMPEPAENAKDDKPAEVFVIVEITQLPAADVVEQDVELPRAITAALTALDDALEREAGPLGITAPGV